MRQHQLSRYGAIAKSLPFTTGKIFFVLNSSDANYSDFVGAFPPDEDGQVRVFSSLETAYAACVSNRGDVLVLGGHGTHTVAAQIAWSKNRIRVIGLDWLLGDKRMVQQSSKIQFALGTEAIAAPIKVTGTRNSFHGLKIMNNSTHASALQGLISAGEGTLYEDCSIMLAVADNLDLTTSFDLLCGEDSGTFLRCSFGNDNLASSGARAVIVLDAVTGGNADGAKNNRFIDCEGLIQSSSASALIVKLADTAGAKFLNRFVNFSAIAIKNQTNSAAAITDAIASATGFVEGSLVFDGLKTANCTNGCATITANVVVSSPVASAGAYEGLTPT